MRRARPRAISVVTALGLGVTLVIAAGCASFKPARESAPSVTGHLGGSASPLAKRTSGRSHEPSTRRSCHAAAAAPRAPVMLSAVQFVSPSDGWLVGSDLILHAADGGHHWVTQFRAGPTARLGAIDFVDADHGWVTGPSQILATTDGGSHWRALPEPCPPIRTVHFVSERDGFAVAGGNLSYWGVTDPPLSGGVLLRTSDGGAHWHRLPAPPDVQTACFNNRQHGWLSAGGPSTAPWTGDGRGHLRFARAASQVRTPRSSAPDREPPGPR